MITLPTDIPAHNEQQWEALNAKISSPSYLLIATDHPQARDQLLEQLVRDHEQFRHIAFNLAQDRIPSLADALMERVPEDILEGELPNQAVHCMNLEVSVLYEIVEGTSVLIPELQAKVEHFTKPFPFLLIVWTDLFMLSALENEAPGFYTGASGVFRFFSVGKTELEENPYQKLAENISALQQSTDAKESATICHQIATLFESFDQPEEAMNYYHQALEYCEQTEAPELMANSYLKTADLLAIGSDLMQAIDAYEMALEGFGHQEDHEKEGIIHRKMANLYRNGGSVNDAKSEFILAIESFESAGLPIEMGHTYQQLAKIFERKGNLDHAIEQYESAASCFQQVGESAEQAKAIQQIGAINQDQLKWSEALQAFEKALPLAEEAGDDFLTEALHDSIENMKEQIQKQQKKGKKGLFGKLFG